MQPFLDDDTRPVKVPVCVQAVRACRPAITRIMGPGVGETFPVPTTGEQGIVIGRAESATVRVDDLSVSRQQCRIWSQDGTVLLTDLESRNGTIVNGKAVLEVALNEGDKIQVGTGTVFRYSLNDRLDESYLDHLYQTSIRDPLTGLLNRRYLLECLERDLALSQRHGLTIAVILIDVDHFKGVNDSWGHRGGDEALRDLALRLQAMQRKESLIARYGGEEFAVLLRSVSAEGVDLFAERMRMAVEAQELQAGRGRVGLTVSMGVAITSADGAVDPEALLEMADRYLYLSKTRGRNCVTSARTFPV